MDVDGGINAGDPDGGPCPADIKGAGFKSTPTHQTTPHTCKHTGGYAIVGCGDGNLIIVDIAQGRMLYGMGAHKVSAKACLLPQAP